MRTNQHGDRLRDIDLQGDRCSECGLVDDCVCVYDPEGDFDNRVEEQRQKGYETFNDYIQRTGFPADQASYAAWISEGRWLITCQPSKYGS